MCVCVCVRARARVYMCVWGVYVGHVSLCMWACGRVCVRACVRACVRTCVRACVRACVRECLPGSVLRGLNSLVNLYPPVTCAPQ